MQRYEGYLSTSTVREFPADRAAGTVLMVLSAVLIPLTVMGAFVATVFTGGLAILHEVFPSLHVHSTGPNYTLFHLMSSLAILAGLVFAGYGISRSQKQAFVVGLAIGVAALLFHSAFFIALPTVIYTAVRLTGAVGPKPV